MNYELWIMNYEVGCREGNLFHLWGWKFFHRDWLLILNPLSNAQKTGFSEKPVFYSCTHAKRGINNQFLITGFSITPNPMFDKDKQKLLIDDKNLRIFKLTVRNIYKFLKINWERFLFNNDVMMVTAILLNFIMGFSVLFRAAMVETLATPRR